MTHIHANSVNFYDLLTNTNFQINHHHRKYCWDYGKIIQLEDDILNLTKWNKSKPNKINYYMGNLILQPIQNNDNSTYLIIDGTNRLITLSLFLSRILHQLINLTNYKNDKIKYKKLISQLLYTGNRPKIKLSNTDDTQHYLNLLKNGASDSPYPDIYSPFPHRDRLVFNTHMLHIPQRSIEYLLDLFNVITTQLYFTIFFVNNDFEANLTITSSNNRGESYNELEILKHYLLLWVNNNIQNKEQHNQLTNKIIILCEKISHYYDITGLDVKDAFRDISETNKALKNFVQHVYETVLKTNNPQHNNDQNKDNIETIGWWRSFWNINKMIPMTNPSIDTILNLLQTLETEYDQRNQ